MSMPFSALLLAGGTSSRMGRDKAWIEVDGRPLIERQLALLTETGAEEIFISGRADTDYSALGWPVLLDGHSHAGPLAGIERGLAAASEPWLLVLAVDLPRMDGRFLRWLLEAGGGDTGMVPRLDGRLEPLAALYPSDSHEFARQALAEGRNSVQAYAHACEAAGLVRFLDVPADARSLFHNCNTPEDV